MKSGEVTLYTRNGLDWTDKFPGIARALKKLKMDSAILDGEAVVLDEMGRSDFQALQASLKEGRGNPPVYFVFDLLFLDGVDLRNVPLLERKEKLEEVLKKSKLSLVVDYSEHVRRGGGDNQEGVQFGSGGDRFEEGGCAVRVPPRSDVGEEQVHEPARVCDHWVHRSERSAMGLGRCCWGITMRRGGWSTAGRKRGRGLMRKD